MAPGSTGIFFDYPVVHSLGQALNEVEAQQWDRALLRQHAAGFSRAQFTEKFVSALTALR